MSLTHFYLGIRPSDQDSFPPFSSPSLHERKPMCWWQNISVEHRWTNPPLGEVLFSCQPQHYFPGRFSSLVFVRRVPLFSSDGRGFCPINCTAETAPTPCGADREHVVRLFNNDGCGMFTGNGQWVHIRICRTIGCARIGFSGVHARGELSVSEKLSMLMY